MKRIILLITIFFWAIILQSQDYNPMVKNEVCWQTTYVDNISLPPISEPSNNYFTGFQDTLIDGVTYVPLSIVLSADPIEFDLQLIGYLREDIQEKKVYFRNISEEYNWLNCESEEMLLYDFSAQPGDTVFHCQNSDNFYIVQTVEYQEEFTDNQIDFSIDEGGYVYEVLSSQFDFTRIFEGIGSNSGPVHFPLNVSTPGSDILSVFIDGCAFVLNTDAPFPTKINLYPNPINGVLHIEFPQTPALLKVNIYNSSGLLQVTEELFESQNKINLEHLSDGLYFLVATDTENRFIYSEKLIIAK